MKREHSAYFEYFVEQVPKSTDWSCRALIYRLPDSIGPRREIKGVEKDEASARKAGHAAGAAELETHRIKKAGE